MSVAMTAFLKDKNKVESLVAKLAVLKDYQMDTQLAVELVVGTAVSWVEKTVFRKAEWTVVLSVANLAVSKDCLMELQLAASKAALMAAE